VPPLPLLLLLVVWLGHGVVLCVLAGAIGLALFLVASALGCCGYLAAGWPGTMLMTGVILVIGLTVRGHL
jgi:hypothetical protein